ncbi:MAG: hemolysin family protein [Hyphomicrobiales bacterium]|nr:hemolysin family protein [Hyphomicrobiales bacterium]
MTDAHSQSTGATGETKTVEARGDVSPKSGESWLDRLRAAVGWKSSPTDLRENLETALEEAGEGGFSAEEREMIRNILHLGETRVDDVMVSRSDIEGIDEETTLERVLFAFMISGHSRMPVYRESLDEAIGMVHIRDLMTHLARAGQIGDDPETASLDLSRADLSVRLAATGLVRPVLFVPGSMPASDLLARMQTNRIQMALVIDEYGGVDGLVSLEDIVETVVGDIEDEHDEGETPDVVAAEPDRWLADARAELDETAEALDYDFSGVGLDEEVETIGGLVVALAGRVPEVGETFVSERLPGLAVEILDADNRRLKRLGLRRVAPEPSEAT